MIEIRNEEERDYKKVEEVTRAAFWNLYVPGCDEHYLTHIMRSHEDFIRDLDFVIEVDGEIVGNIMYTKAKLIDESGGREKTSSPLDRSVFCRSIRERDTEKNHRTFL